MVNERAPPNLPPREDNAPSKPTASYDDDDVTQLVRGWGSIKGNVRDALVRPKDGSAPDQRAVALDSAAKQQHAFGHPSKMASSRKQQADVFIHQRTRPEHHLGGTRVAPPPREKSFKDLIPGALPMYDSNAAPQRPPAARKYGEETFFTDPTKASADLKALLEGGMEDDDEEEGDKTPGEEKADEAGTEATNHKDGTIEGLKIKLLPHQVEGVQWMRGRELGPVKRGRVPKGGILADDMGLGKTLQTVSLILMNRKPHEDAKGWKKQYKGLDKTTLVVAPLALIRQWEAEIKDKVAKTANLKVLVHHGPQRTKDFKTLALYDVVITTYQTLVSEHAATVDGPGGLKVGCFGLNWWRVVLDEAHTIKNRNAKGTKACYALPSEYRWCLSGTPLQNNLDELQSLVKFLRIKPYDDLKEWKEHIDKPMKNGKGHIAIRRLHSLLRCFMKRRTKEILKVDGALNPGGKPSKDGVSSTGLKVTERKVLTVSTELTAAERRFYDRLEARADRNMEAMAAEAKVNYASAFTLLLRLRQACNHPKLVEGKLGDDTIMRPNPTIKPKSEADLDDIADMFAGMGIASKKCNICGKAMEPDSPSRCDDCAEDLALFATQGAQDGEKPSKKKKTKVKKVERKTKETMPARRPRNRNAVIDSDDDDDDDDDDEEADGSWLVGKGEQGDLRLGKAGGEEDENAEGGGDWLGTEDSQDETDHDKSNLSSFVVNDEGAKNEPGYQSAADDSDDSLLSLKAITNQMASQTLDDKKPRPSSPELSDDETESDATSDTDNEVYTTSGGRKNAPVLASAKIRELIKILRKETAEHKFIVFSEFTSMLDLVEPFLDDADLLFTRYDGKMRNDEREESLRRLREEKRTRVLLCSLKCGSLGLNLTAATRVVILEPFWNPFVEEQAIDRVHRLTQTVDVVVYRLTVRGTVEERILALQEKKRELAAQALEAGSTKAGLKLGLNEIIDLFRPGGGGGDDVKDPIDLTREAPGGSSGERKGHREGYGLLGKTAVNRRPESEVYGRRW